MNAEDVHVADLQNNQTTERGTQSKLYIVIIKGSKL